ncbi:unnamed protein product, partial [marine sediment metagenome]
APKKVIIESNKIAIITAKMTGVKSPANGKIAVVIVQQMNPIKRKDFLLPLTSLNVPINIVVKVPTVVVIATIKAIYKGTGAIALYKKTL